MKDTAIFFCCNDNCRSKEMGDAIKILEFAGIEFRRTNQNTLELPWIILLYVQQTSNIAGIRFSNVTTCGNCSFTAQQWLEIKSRQRQRGGKNGPSAVPEIV